MADKILQASWLIALVPLVSSLLIMFFAHRCKITSAFLSIGAVFYGLIHSLLILYISYLNPERTLEINFPWISAGAFKLFVGYLIDPLCAMMLVVVCVVSFFVQVYTHGYMKEDPNYSKFYAYLSLFTFSMLGLVFSTNLFQSYIFWELVGVCSYLLIGFWWYKPSAANACTKAFVVNRIGDAGLLIGLLMLYSSTQNFWLNKTTLAFGQLKNAIDFAIGSHLLPVVGIVSVTTIALFVLMGPMAKSAQFPLHVWLPDAMEGPTPISALIHAATMVAAGVYLIARCYPLYIAAPVAMATVAWIGGITAIFAATIALSQFDIKRTLAYSTCSQLGYMVMALGLGAYSAGLFHLMTHAFFKAMLFLCSGSVIVGCHHEQDIRQMGGLRKHMPITSLTCLVGVLAISGFPLMSGFWSKDMILASAWEHNKPLFIIGSVTALLTAFYMFRLYFMTFEGEYRGHAHPHETTPSITIPLICLAVPSIFIGLIGSPLIPGGDKFSSFIHFGEYHAHHEWGINVFVKELLTTQGLIPLFAFIVGTIFAWMVYRKGFALNTFVKKNLSFIYNLSFNKWYVDEVYFWVLNRIILPCYRVLWSVIDKTIVDGVFVNGSARVAAIVGGGLRFIETGRGQLYALVIFGSVLFAVLFLITRIAR
ncbi:MAG: NADH-quinone oxidoreductase subunit L [Candidatus Melainabacteria bacterium]|nr:NADH-quinone oxidoreductase subunit L [Candidatus Melainabacteria bacterium]